MTTVAISLGNTAAGMHTLTIEKREVVTIPPRLDVFCLTKDGVTPPTDSQACALVGCP